MPADELEERCDSCGHHEADLTPVKRVYVTPESWDSEATVDVQDEVERWCFSCLTHYPHQVLDEPR